MFYYHCKPEFLFNKYFNLQKHESECLLKVVQCPNSACSEKLTKQDMKTHVSSECSWRKIKCEYCREPFVFNQKQVCRYPYKQRKLKIFLLECHNQNRIPVTLVKNIQDNTLIYLFVYLFVCLFIYYKLQTTACLLKSYTPGIV